MDTALDSRHATAEKAGMTPETCRAGRALLGLSQTEFASRVGVTPLTVRNYEAGKSDPTYTTWRTMKTVLERGGVLFVEEDDKAGPGVRLRKPR